MCSSVSNKKSFYNLGNYYNDFDVQASWSFFCTSHGKSLCDGFGGTVKPSAAMESLKSYYGIGDTVKQSGAMESLRSYCSIGGTVK